MASDMSEINVMVSLDHIMYFHDVEGALLNLAYELDDKDGWVDVVWNCMSVGRVFKGFEFWLCFLKGRETRCDLHPICGLVRQELLASRHLVIICV
jgi:hypothetical protein